MAKKKTLSAQEFTEQLLAGLRAAIDGGAHKLQGTPSSPGLFPNTAPGPALAEKALDSEFLREVPAPAPPKATRTKSTSTANRYVSITDKGRQFVQEQDSPAKLVGALRDSLQQQGAVLATEVETARAEVRAFREGVDGLLSVLDEHSRRYQATASALQAAVDRLARQPTPVSPIPRATNDGHSADWLDEVVRFVRDHKRVNPFSIPTLPRIYQHLRQTRPSLTLGQFHDGLRTLQAQRKILLGPYTQAPATIEDAQNALFLDREVKYYVDLP